MFDAVAHLTRQHAHCDHAFLAVEKAVQTKDWDKVDILFNEARSALLGHLQLEEQTLFPAFEQATGIVGGPTAVMCAEHEAMRDILVNCDSLRGARDARGLMAELDTLFVLVQQHNVKEENVLYPMCALHVKALEQLLSKAQGAKDCVGV